MPVRPAPVATVSRMRHFSTLIAALVAGPLSWLLLAFGQDGSAQTFAKGTGDFPVGPALCLAGAALLLGLLATPWFSPLGLTLTGAGYAASYLALLLDPAGVLGLFPRSLSVAGLVADPSTPLRSGTTLLLGAVMMVAMVPRWQRRSSAAELARKVPAKRATVAAEPESVTRYLSSPRRTANKRPNSYGPTDNGTDRWHATRPVWPYAQDPRPSGQ